MSITRRKFGLYMVVLFSLALFFIVMSTRPAILAYAGEGEIRVYSENPHYWEYRGKPVLLLGGSDDDNLFNNPALMMKNLEILEKIKGNYIRCTLSCRDEGNVWPYVKKNSRYDLENFNPEFWNRLETCIREAEKRDIIVQVEIWATFDYYRDNWSVNPFNPVMNVNYTTVNTRLKTEWNYPPYSKPQPFFYSPPSLNDDSVLRGYQDAFVRKVLDVTRQYSNVLFSLDNETKAPAEWALYWGDFIRSEAEKQGRNIQLTEMWDAGDISDSEHITTYAHPEFFSFTDVSQNNWQEGQTHYDRLLWYRQNLAGSNGGIRPMNNVKVYALKYGDNTNDTEISVDRWWQNVFAGCASTRFHRPGGGIGLDATAQKVIRATRVFTSAFDIFECEPRPDLLSGREENEAYCLACPGKVYAVYFPDGGDVNLEVYRRESGYRIRWFDPDTASFSRMKPDEEEEAIIDSKHISRRMIILKTPGEGATWLALVEVL